MVFDETNIIFQMAGVLPTYCGTWNAETNIPFLQSGNGENGQLFKVSHNGKTNLDGVTKWSMGDFLFFANGCWNGLTYACIYQLIEKEEKYQSSLKEKE
jgi:hypothetical protein